MVKQTTALNALSGNDIAVASPSTTVTFGGAAERRRAASTGSSSSAVSDGARPASTRVVIARPGSELEHGRPQVHIGQYPREQALLNVALPASRTGSATCGNGSPFDGTTRPG